MRVESRGVPPPKFQPIAVTITIESPEEMAKIKSILSAGVTHNSVYSYNDLRPLLDQLTPAFTPV